MNKLLLWCFDTATKMSRHRSTRQANLKNAFALAPGAVIMRGHHYILTDDFFTTGSTLNACAVVLRRISAVTLEVATNGQG